MTSPTIEIPQEIDRGAPTLDRAIDSIETLAPYVRDEAPVRLPVREALRRLLAGRQPRRAIWRLRSPAARADARTWRAQDIATIRHVIRLARAGAQTVRILWVE